MRCIKPGIRRGVPRTDRQARLNGGERVTPCGRRFRPVGNYQRLMAILTATPWRGELCFLGRMTVHPLADTARVHGRRSERQRRRRQHAHQQQHQQDSGCPTLHRKKTPHTLRSSIGQPLPRAQATATSSRRNGGWMWRPGPAVQSFFDKRLQPPQGLIPLGRHSIQVLPEFRHGLRI